MKTGLFHTLCLSAVLMVAGSSNSMAAVHSGATQASAKKSADRGTSKHSDHKIKFILKHASDAKLTDDQVTKIKALEGQTFGKKGLKHQLKSILSKDQIATLKALHKHHKK